MDTPDWTQMPTPQDDGAASHLPGTVLPDLALPSTEGADLSLGTEPERVVVFVYPMIAGPDGDTPEGWSEIPGAPGCTAQACAYRDRLDNLIRAGATRVVGVSTQGAGAQAEASGRLGLPYPLLSDHELRLAEQLMLPRFELHGETYLRRLTMILENGTVRDVHYPVYPPDSDVAWAEDRLAAMNGSATG